MYIKYQIDFFSLINFSSGIQYNQFSFIINLLISVSIYNLGIYKTLTGTFYLKNVMNVATIYWLFKEHMKYKVAKK